MIKDKLASRQPNAAASTNSYVPVTGTDKRNLTGPPLAFKGTSAPMIGHTCFFSQYTLKVEAKGQVERLQREGRLAEQRKRRGATVSFALFSTRPAQASCGSPTQLTSAKSNAGDQCGSLRQLEAILQQFAEVFEGRMSRDELWTNEWQDWTNDYQQCRALYRK
jgi:hypothetical protein